MSQTPLKIMFVHHAIGMGGAPNSLAYLIRKMDHRTHHVVVVMPDRPGNEKVKKLFSDAGANVVQERQIRPFNGVNGCRCDSLKDRAYAILSALPTLWAVRKHVRHLKPSVVHLNTTVLPFAAAGAKFSGQSVPVIVHVRETLLTNWWGRLLGFLNRRFATHFIGIDQYGIERIKATESQATVIRNFVDRTQFHPEAGDRNFFRDQLGFKSDDVVFTSISRIAISNGSRELAQFLAKYAAKISPNAKFVICGFSDRTSAYARETLSAIGENKNVFAQDFTTRVIDLIAGSDVIVAPFKSAHSARMIIEGSAMARPGLVTDFPNLVEQIVPDESGFVIDFEQPDDTIAKINRLCEDEELRKRMGKAAEEFAAKNYDDGFNSQRTVDVYRSLLGHRSND